MTRLESLPFKRLYKISRGVEDAMRRIDIRHFDSEHGFPRPARLARERLLALEARLSKLMFAKAPKRRR